MSGINFEILTYSSSSSNILSKHSNACILIALSIQNKNVF